MIDGPVQKTPVDRFIDAIELTAAVFLAVVTLLVFVSVFLRYLFAWGIPDAHDFSRLLLGILIFWGMAVASYRGDHITVDLLWSAASPRYQRAIDVLAAVITLAAMAVFTVMMAVKVWNNWLDHELTYDLRVPIWPYYFLAWLGLAASIVLLIARTFRLVFWPERLAVRTPGEMID